MDFSVVGWLTLVFYLWSFLHFYFYCECPFIFIIMSLTFSWQVFFCIFFLFFFHFPLSSFFNCNVLCSIIEITIKPQTYLITLEHFLKCRFILLELAFFGIIYFPVATITITAFYLNNEWCRKWF